MLSFKNDYSEGCAKEILKALAETNELQTTGYGEDEFCSRASDLIKDLVGDENAQIYFLVGGTQTNLTVISALRPYDAVISCDTGHINVHETGAIEATGHKVITVKNNNAKLSAQDVENVMKSHTDHHMVLPKMVYISNSTEYGTIYSKAELVEIRKICDQYGLYLFMDGARLGSALTASNNDLTLADIYRFCDIFYIGGTKNGALFGEALVIRNNELKVNFNYLIKQHGALLAKGRLLGIQFYELLKSNLYFKLAKHANDCANMIRTKLTELGIKEYMPSTTNQIFIKLPNNIAQKLHEQVIFEDFLGLDDGVVIRFVTSFATKEEDVVELIMILDSILGNANNK